MAVVKSGRRVGFSWVNDSGVSHHGVDVDAWWMTHCSLALAETADVTSP